MQSGVKKIGAPVENTKLADNCVVRAAGIEPATPRLKVVCSTTELRTHHVYCST